MAGSEHLMKRFVGHVRSRARTIAVDNSERARVSVTVSLLLINLSIISGTCLG